MSIYKYITERVSPKAFYEKMLGEVQWREGKSNTDVSCPFHGNTQTTTLSIDPVEGKFYCHSCEVGGNSIISFLAQRENISPRRAAEKIFHSFIHPTIPAGEIKKVHEQLLASPSALKYVTGTRMVNRRLVDKFRLGWSGTRIAFPIVNEFGLTVNAKLYDPAAKRHNTPKMLNWSNDKEKRSYGSPTMLFPLSIIEWVRSLGWVIMAEGEFDALVLLSMGIPAMTSTLGCTSWPSQYNHLFRDLDVYVAYDSDEPDKHGKRAGEEGVKVVLRELRSTAKSINRIIIPTVYPDKAKGKDVTDWVRHDARMRSKTAWLDQLKKAERLLSSMTKAPTTSDRKKVTLHQAAMAEHFNKPLNIVAMVPGKDIAPYILPKKCRVRCGKANPCDSCPVAAANESFLTVDIDPSDPAILSLVGATESNVEKHILDQAGIHDTKCRGEVETVETFNVEQLVLTQPIEHATEQPIKANEDAYVLRSAYFVGHGTIPNRSYLFEGLTVPHPKDQHATHLLTAKVPMQDEIETFKMTPELHKQLKIFQPSGSGVMGKMMSIADWQANHITKIVERPDVHIAIDLAYHSVAAFRFNGEYIARGMLDILVIGDTRCGKGYIAERLTRRYGLGQIASGENCTFAGLVGGLQQIDNRWIVTWGIIPMNHNGSVVIDEVSSMTEREIGHMSRVRSEGVAEITKIMRQETLAMVRLIWLSNTRSGKSIRSYNTGVEAILELMGANEDVSRFDFAMTVANDEVPSHAINAKHSPSAEDADKYPKHLCRSLILWAWSRKADQIKFSAEATSLIIQNAIRLGQKYSPTVPLVQGENIRVKLAKLAAACAARVFSCSDDASSLIVRTEHVEFAVEFLTMIYDKPSMGYNVFSRAANSIRVVENDRVEKLFSALEAERSTIKGLLEMHLITPDALADYMGDVLTAKMFIGDLVQIKCLIREGRDYIKTPAFLQWLRRREKEKSHG